MHDHSTNPQPDRWLKTYYFSRAAFSIAWVAAVLFIGKNSFAVACCLFLLYPAWDAAANLVDARRSGGLRSNPTQFVNAIVSIMTTLALAVALRHGTNAALVVFGAWASLSGLFQLSTGARRWKRFGAQWSMILSGLQSTVAGAHFIQRGSGTQQYDLAVIAPYAAFGAFYFLVSALWLVMSDIRRNKTGAPTL